MKHEYTVEITRAIYTKETFEVFKKYEEHVHKKAGKDKEDYTRFLCESPLYDPTCEEDKAISHWEDDQDSNRTHKNEGAFPKATGSYHMVHRIDGKVAIVGVLDFLDTSLSSVYLFYDP